MTALLFVRTIFFFLIAMVIGRLFAGVSLVWMSLFFLFLTVPMHPVMVILLCLCVDVFFFLPFGLTTLLIGVCGYIFQYVRGGSIVGSVQTVIFFLLFVFIAFLFHRQVHMAAFVGVVFFSFLAIYSSLISSDSVDIG